MSKNTPCYKCKDRHEACHSKCYEYLEFRKQLDKEAEIKRKQHEELSYFIENKKKK